MIEEEEREERQPDLPDWIKEYKKQTAIIDIIVEAVQGSCSCKVCKKLRSIAWDLGEIFFPKRSKV